MAEIPPVPDTGTPEERDLLAAELVLGLLDGEERAAALRLRLSDPTFAAMVNGWQHRFEPLLLAYDDQRPGENVWTGITQRIETQRPLELPSVHSRRWRVTALAASAIAAGLALFLVLRPTTMPLRPAPVSVAQLTGDEKALHVVARYDGSNGILALRATGIEEPGKSPELWIIPSDGKPRSLGLIARQGQSEVTVPTSLRAFLRDGATLAVTMEDAVTAPHEAPSATPIAVGSISVI